jgi:hypothetical protein
MTGQFLGLDAATLTELKTDFVACLKEIAVAGQNYSIGQRNYTRADLAEVRNTIAEINYALDRLSGTRSRVTMDVFNPSFRNS